jgi:hypothetical protein
MMIDWGSPTKGSQRLPSGMLGFRASLSRREAFPLKITTTHATL